MIEIDVSMTRDGVFYAFHNTEEEQEFGRKCDIRKMTSREVDEINLLNSMHTTSGQRLERMEDVLPKFKGKCLINIDRSWFYWEKVIPFLKSMNMDDQILLKCGVEEKYLQQLADSRSGLMYMPIVRTCLLYTSVSAPPHWTNTGSTSKKMQLWSGVSSR